MNRYKFYIVLALCTVIVACSSLITSSAARSNLERSRSASSFVDSMGVVVHFNYRDTVYYKEYEDVIVPRLKQLGIRHLRSNFTLKDTKTQQKFNDLAKLGVRSTLVMNPLRVTPTEAVEIAKTVPNSIEAVEGPNEWDIRPKFEYQGLSFPEGTRKYQQDLYWAIKSDPATASLEVLSPSLAKAKNSSELGQVVCDRAVIHSYPGSGNIPSSGLEDKWIPSARIVCPGKAIVATESGYHNAVNKSKISGVSQQASAKYLPRIFLEYFNRGIVRTYNYELIDLKPNPSRDRPNWNYGLLNNDGSPKPAFIAIKNLITLLQESDQLNSDHELEALDYEAIGSTEEVHHTLLQKNDGRFYLILWQEVLSYQVGKEIDLQVPDRSIKLILNTPIKRANIYQPLNSIQPISQYNNPKRLNIKVPDHPLIIELTPKTNA